MSTRLTEGGVVPADQHRRGVVEGAAPCCPGPGLCGSSANLPMIVNRHRSHGRSHGRGLGPVGLLVLVEGSIASVTGTYMTTHNVVVTITAAALAGSTMWLASRRCEG